MDVQEQGRRALFWVLVGIGCLLVVVSTVAVGAAADVGTQDVAPQADTPSDRLDGADEIHIDVFVHENGSATFVVDYRFENQSDGEWERLRSDIEDDPDAYAESQEERWTDVLREGENETDREMDINNVSVATETSPAPRNMGHVAVTFKWDSFAYRQLNRIEVGEALVDLSLPRNTWLQVYAPEGYTIDEVSPDPEGSNGNTTAGDAETDEFESMRWGESGDPFSSTPPSIVMIQESDSTNGTTGSDGDTDAGPSERWLIVLAALALLVTVGAAGWWLDRERNGTRATSAPNGGATTSEPAAASEGVHPPPELLSNEERVLQLLEERGGRIKQQEVVSELDWTEAKTSQVVSGLREDGEIDVFRIGRENVLAFPDEEDDD